MLRPLHFLSSRKDSSQGVALRNIQYSTINYQYSLLLRGRTKIER